MGNFIRPLGIVCSECDRPNTLYERLVDYTAIIGLMCGAAQRNASSVTVNKPLYR